MLDVPRFGYNFDIAIAATIVFLVGYGILSRITNRRVAVIVMALKVGIVLIYFCFFEDGAWFIGGDDYAYFYRSNVLFSTGRNPITLWWHPESIYLKTQHSRTVPLFLFYFAQYIFGPNYYSPVFFNVLVTVVSTLFVYHILSRISENCGVNYAIFGAIYFTLHWSTLVWSSFLVLREPIITCLVLAVTCFLLLLPKYPVRGVLGFIVSIYLLARSRFYFPSFIVVGIVTPLLNKLTLRYSVLGTVILCLIVAVLYAPEARLFMQLANFSDSPYNLVHFLLQPAPWKITPPASYLLIPSILNWLLIIPTFLGGILFLRISWRTRLIAGTALAGILFYTFIPAISSTRHRAPLDALMILMQYHFFYFVFTAICRQVWPKTSL